MKSAYGELDLNAVYDVKVRFDSLRDDINYHLATASGRSHALDRLMQDFGSFCTDYFNYFAGLDPAEYEAETTKAELLSSILSKLSREWGAISQAAQQRGLSYAKDLAEADGWATRYYASFAGQDRAVAMVTYFQKVEEIAQFPYSDVPLIGIPLDAMKSDAAIMATAHEVGHYVYSHATSVDQQGQVERDLSRAVSNRLRAEHTQELNDDPRELRRLSLLIDTWLQWLNECFADLYGCLVAGPYHTRSGQDLYLQQIGNADDLALDDGEHPAPYLRPLIQTTALRILAGEQQQMGEKETAEALKQAADALESRWQWSIDRLPGSAGELKHEPTGLPLEDIKADLKLVVECILGEPVFDGRNESGEKKSLLQAAQLFITQPDALLILGQLTDTIYAEQERRDKIQPDDQGAQPTSQAFIALKAALAESSRGTAKPLWRRLADVELATVSAHPWSEAHSYTYHGTRHVGPVHSHAA